MHELDDLRTREGRQELPVVGTFLRGLAGAFYLLPGDSVNCYHCGRRFGRNHADNYYCYGCGVYVCVNCDRNGDLGFPGTTHKPADHLIESGERITPDTAGDCIVCQDRIPEWRGKKNTCCDKCETDKLNKYRREQYAREKERCGIPDRGANRDDRGRFGSVAQ